MVDYKRGWTLIPVKKETRAILKIIGTLEKKTYDDIIRDFISKDSFRGVDYK